MNITDIIVKDPFSRLGIRFFYDPVTAVAAGAAVVTAGVSIYNATQSNKQADRDKKRLDIQKEQNDLTGQQAEQSARDQLLSASGEITSLETSISNIGVDIAEAESKVSGYQSFLDRYGDYYKTETTKAQAGIAELEASGKAAYENLMQTMGYADALAGATGRVAAGSSMAHVGQKTKSDVIDYVGEDMTLDETGGLYGQQRTAASLSYDQLLLDLEAERTEAEQQKKIWGMSLESLLESKKGLEKTLGETRERHGELETWVDETFQPAVTQITPEQQKTVSTDMAVKMLSLKPFNIGKIL